MIDLAEQEMETHLEREKIMMTSMKSRLTVLWDLDGFCVVMVPSARYVFHDTRFIDHNLHPFIQKFLTVGIEYKRDYSGS
jgi:hypothetical protein